MMTQMVRFSRVLKTRAQYLHANIQAGVFMGPVGKAFQVRIERRKVLHLAAGRQTVYMGPNDGNHQK